jgi:hypothetical protein
MQQRPPAGAPCLAQGVPAACTSARRRAALVLFARQPAWRRAPVALAVWGRSVSLCARLCMVTGAHVCPRPQPHGLVFCGHVTSSPCCCTRCGAGQARVHVDVRRGGGLSTARPCAATTRLSRALSCCCVPATPSRLCICRDCWGVRAWLASVTVTGVCHAECASISSGVSAVCAAASHGCRLCSASVAGVCTVGCVEVSLLAAVGLAAARSLC